MPKNPFIIPTCIVSLIALFVFPDTVAEGVDSAVKLLVNILLPSLFPFMSLIGFMTLSGVLENSASPEAVHPQVFFLPDTLGTPFCVDGGRISRGRRSLPPLSTREELPASTPARSGLLYQPGAGIYRYRGRDNGVCS
jgi:hypothetical protein